MSQPEYLKWLHQHLETREINKYQFIEILHISQNDVRTWTIPRNQHANFVLQLSNQIENWFKKKA